MTNKVTREDFIKRFSAIYPDYDFNESEFNGMHKKITIKCKIHGYFEKIPSNLKYSGCRKCGFAVTAKKLKTNPAEAIRKIKNIYAGFSFDESSYKNNRSKINCICPIHGFFSKSYSSLLMKMTGCSRCKIESKNKTVYLQNKYINKLKLRKHKFLNEDQTIYFGSNKPAHAHCEKHGFFKKIASDLLNTGCTKCNIESHRMGFSDFLIRSVEIHGEKYHYYEDSWINSDKKIKIKCSTHGDFWQNPRKHTLSKQGCPECASFGYTRSDFIKKSKEINNGYGFLYLIKCFNDDEVFYKIGITSRTIKARFTNSTMPYNYRVIDFMELKAINSYNKEKELMKSLQSFRYQPNLKFGGSTKECFSKVYFKGRIYE